MDSNNKEDKKLTNKDSVDEPYDVLSSLKNMKKTEDGISGKFNITISLRDKSSNNCEYNLELIKYKYIIEDMNNNINIINKELKQQVFLLIVVVEKSIIKRRKEL